MSYVSKNRSAISVRHYIRKATTVNYWFDFSLNKLKNYKSRYGEDFCLVINGSETADDAYILPYSAAKRIFTPDCVDHRNRWIGQIVNHVLHLSPSGVSMNVKAYYNALDLITR